MRRSAATLAPATSKAAFIGLGAIGKVLAGRVALAPELASLSVFQRRPQVGRELAAAHAGKVTAAADVAEAVRGAEVVFTCLPRSSNVKVRPWRSPLLHRRHHRRHRRRRGHHHAAPTTTPPRPTSPRIALQERRR